MTQAKLKRNHDQPRNGSKFARKPAPVDPLTGETLETVQRVTATDTPATGAQSLSDAAIQTFRELGGMKWMRKYAKEFPKEFMSLMARTAPDEGVSGGMSYVAVPIPVEQRERSHGVLEPIEALDPLS